VDDAVRLGADAVGYTMYIGSPAQDRDFIQFREVRIACERAGMPLIVWAYPRGSAIKTKGGRDSLYAVAYAARVAAELGADLVKINFPKPGRSEGAPKPYSEWDLEPLEAAKHAISSAARTPVLISGGEKEDDDSIVEKARLSFEAGATGLIFGRNMFQRKLDDALRLCDRLHELAAKFGQ
jgi:class I fructose-bisphosphate aldolase